MRKCVALLPLSRQLLQKKLKSEVNPANLVLRKYSTSAESSTNREKLNESVRIVPMNPQDSSAVDDIFLKDLVKDMKNPSALDECDEDMSDLGPYHRPSFNFAAYANKSETIQELVKLGVELWKLEAQQGAMEAILSKKFEEMKPYIQFLHDCGVPVDRISTFITKNPLIFKEDMDDLRTRIRYLRAHNFDKNDIARIVTEAPRWLSWRTDEIDNKLAYFQREFQLSGSEVRALVHRRPQLITFALKDIRDNTFAIKEEMGFDDDQAKEILLNKPKIWEKARLALIASFIYVHEVMEIPHEIIAKQPSVIATRVERLKQRHLFLVALKRAQYDAKKPLYVPLDSLAMGTDFEFCTKRAKSSIELYDMFLKTL
ncbi:transcription termination factor 3, mitochondrial [Diachasma alloeum]|uniref:transcription termination factor 3, mitochondrial n=1 Tax=Diachasma alloeum TaxID=454923 RepID=UPI00073839A1|nr:transcription termination factor 3, mitochondrial [Diachasma alloeum]